MEPGGVGHHPVEIEHAGVVVGKVDGGSGVRHVSVIAALTFLSSSALSRPTRSFPHKRESSGGSACFWVPAFAGTSEKTQLEVIALYYDGKCCSNYTTNRSQSP
jgi:hypothetical protein